MINPIHFSSATDDWSTPESFMQHIKRMFNITLDACATAENAQATCFFTEHDNGLIQSWKTDGVVWLNPPYGRGISKWIEKAYQTSQEGTPVICLLPARTDTIWWHKYCSQGLVYLIKGRLKFGNSKNSAPFPSALVIFPVLS